MKSLDNQNLIIENARIIFRNFAGKETKFNRPGNRNFGVVIEDHDVVPGLKSDGWNVRRLEPREEGDEPLFYLPVSVRFDIFPPSVFVITSRSHIKTQLEEDSIARLDYADIKQVDLEIRPHHWEVNGGTGLKAYLKNMYVVIEEDILAEKYAYLDERDD